MLKRYTFWLSAAVLFQFISALFHTVTLFINPEPANDTERQLNQMMATYKPELGPGFHPSYADLVTALSSCFTFVCLLGGLTVGYLLIKHTEPRFMKGIAGINALVFGVMFLVLLYFTFWLPVVQIGLVFINYLIGYFVIPRHVEPNY